MPTRVVSYALDGETTVSFEIEPLPDFAPAGADRVVARVKDAVTPAVHAARVVLEQFRSADPDEVAVKFGMKASGRIDWLVARTAMEGNFEVTVTWKRTAAELAGGAGGG